MAPNNARDTGERVVFHQCGSTHLESRLPKAPGEYESDALEDEALGAFESGDLQRARELLIAAGEAQKVRPTVWLNFGLVLTSLGMREEAVRVYSKVIDEFPEAIAQRGLNYDQLGEVEYAAADYRTALGNDPSDVDTLVNYGLLELGQDNVEHAEELLSRAAALDPAAQWQLGDVLIRTGRYDEARKALYGVISSGELRANLDLALLEAQLGENAQAEEHFRLAIEWGSTLGRREYSAFLLRVGRDAEALRATEDGVKADDDWCFAPLAIALERAGAHGDAERFAARARDVGDEDFLQEFRAAGPNR